MTDGERKLIVNNNLSAISEQLASDDFFQLARNFTVSIRAITKVHKYFRGRLTVTLTAGTITERVVVSASRRDQFLSWYASL